MDSLTFPKLKPRPKGVLKKTLSINVKQVPPSPSRVTFDSVAHDIQTGEEVPPSPRTRDQFYVSVIQRRRRARLDARIREIKAELAAEKALKDAAEAVEKKAADRRRYEELKRKVAEMDRKVAEAHAKAKKYDAKVGFGLNEGWYSNMILCMQAVYC